MFCLRCAASKFFSRDKSLLKRRFAAAFLLCAGFLPGFFAVYAQNADKTALNARLERALASYNRPPAARIKTDPDAFLNDLQRTLSVSGDLLTLVDKTRAAPAGYEPNDLVKLVTGKSYIPNRDNLFLRAAAEQALEKMAAAALKENITLLASSAYRSYDYQKTVYERNVRELGQAAADRESSRPGHSQHQLGTVVDFGSITDDYAQTRAGKWLSARAGEYGFSLSFPVGMEAITGYRWECWHYRYIGAAAVDLQKSWFDDVQQYMLEFIYEWERAL